MIIDRIVAVIITLAFIYKLVVILATSREVEDIHKNDSKFDRIARPISGVIVFASVCYFLFIIWKYGIII